jgi:hypothetical protein
MTQHELFKQFPLNGEAETSLGTVSTPYHIYDGHGMLIGGTAVFESVATLIANENITPLRNEAGKALMAVWVCDFTDASLGAHNELQFSIFVSHRETTAVSTHPLGTLHAMVTNPDVRMLCHGLWNNTDKVVAYNRELLGLNAQLNEGEIVRENGRKRFTFRDANGELLFRGDVAEAKRTGLSAGWQMGKLFGLKGAMDLAKRPFLSSKVVNTISERLPFNTDADAHIAADNPVVQLFDPRSDHIEFGQEPYRSLGFTPQFIEHLTPFRFVYLNPTTD